MNILSGNVYIEDLRKNYAHFGKNRYKTSLNQRKQKKKIQKENLTKIKSKIDNFLDKIILRYVPSTFLIFSKFNLTITHYTLPNLICLNISIGRIEIFILFCLENFRSNTEATEL